MLYIAKLLNYFYISYNFFKRMFVQKIIYSYIFMMVYMYTIYRWDLGFLWNVSIILIEPIYIHTPCSLLAVKCVGGRCRWLLMLLLPCCKRGALCSVLKTVTSNYQYFLCNGLSYLSRESKYPACNKITMKTANLSPVCFFTSMKAIMTS